MNRVFRLSGALLALVLLTACASSKERLLAQGYPPAFANGYEDGCGSGRQAAGALDNFRKDVPAYLADAQYATGWDDGFRQCQASTTADIERKLQPRSESDREWRRHVDQQMAKALSQSLHQD